MSLNEIYARLDAPHGRFARMILVALLYAHYPAHPRLVACSEGWTR